MWTSCFTCYGGGSRWSWVRLARVPCADCTEGAPLVRWSTVGSLVAALAVRP